MWPCNQLYNGLVKLDKKLDIKPDIAKEWYFDDKKNKAAKIPLLIVDESELKKQSKLEIPSFVPSHHSYTTTIPAEQQKVLHSFTTSDIVEPSWETHLYSNGTCALLKWLAFNYTSSLFYYDKEEYE